MAEMPKMQEQFFGRPPGTFSRQREKGTAVHKFAMNLD